MELMWFSPAETLNIAALVETAINAVAYNDMVEDFAVHEFCGLRECLREFDIFP